MQQVTIFALLAACICLSSHAFALPLPQVDTAAAAPITLLDVENDAQTSVDAASGTQRAARGLGFGGFGGKLGGLGGLGHGLGGGFGGLGGLGGLGGFGKLHSFGGGFGGFKSLFGKHFF